MKKILSLIFSLLILTGCTNLADKENVLNLLSSPKLSKRESDIVTAITDYLGQDIILKYPRRGNNFSPVQMVDLIGNSEKEAVVMYIAPGIGVNVRICILSNETGKWVVKYDSEGFGKNIYNIDFNLNLEKRAYQIVVGYTFSDSSEKFLTVYTIDDDNEDVNMDVQTFICQDYALYDVTDDGLDELIVAGLSGNNKHTQIIIMTADETGKFNNLTESTLSVPNAQVTNIKFSKNEFSENEAIVIDYYDSRYRVTTQGMCYIDGELKTLLSPDTVQKYWNYDYYLNSRDVDGDGYIETPTIISTENSHNEDLKFMEWTSFFYEKPDRKYFGVCNAPLGMYFPLPDAWQNYVYLEGEGNEWKVLKLSDCNELIKFEKVSYADEFELEENQKIVSEGTNYVKVTFDESVSIKQQNYICNGFIYIK